MKAYVSRSGRIVLTLLICTATATAEFSENRKFSLKLTPRLESAQQSGRRSSDAFTLGTNIGYTHAMSEEFKISIEVEDTRALDEDSYNPAGLNPRSTNRAVIADPEGTEINQAWVSYAVDGVNVKLGRQAIVLDNARFIGNVGWRQNMQTFDALQASVANETIKFTYAYLDQINRILGDDHPAGQWDSESHVANLNWKLTDQISLAGYSYLLSFKNAAANSTVTHGLFLSGSRSISDSEQLTYRAEFALQREHDNSPLNYEAPYSLLEFGLNNKIGAVTFGREILGSDNGTAFKTPLATGHAFNGWADLFLATPPTGLEDRYIKVTAALPQALKGAVAFHHFSSDEGNQSWGTEWDFSLARAFGPKLSVLAKAGNFTSSSSRPDVTKFWLQAVYSY